MDRKEDRFFRPQAVILFAVVWTLLWTFPKWKAPAVSYEWKAFIAAVNLEHGRGPIFDGQPYLTHPPLYFHMLGWGFHLFGETTTIARAVGWLFLVLQAAALLALARVLRLSRATAATAAFLFLCSAAVLQGALLIDIASDNALLSLSILLLLTSLVALADNPAVSRWMVVVLLSAAALWSKTTTVMALPICFAAILAARSSRAFALRSAAAFGCGMLLFVSTWWFYCWAHGEPSWFAIPFSPFHQDMVARTKEAVGGRWRGVAVEGLRAVLWISPWWTILFIREAIGAVIEWGKDVRMDLLRAFVSVVGIGYTLLGTHTHHGGCFKYAAPALPVLCLLMARAEERDLRDLASVRKATISVLNLAGFVAWMVAVVGDPLLTLNHDVRLATALGESVRPSVQHLAFQLLMAAVPIVVLLARFGSSNWRWVVLIAGLGWNLGLDVIQWRAPYRTAAGYGSTGFDASVGFVESRIQPDDGLIAWQDIRGQIRRPYRGAMGGRPWTDENVLAALRRGEWRFFVFGLASSPVESMRAYLTDERFRSALARSQPTRFGDYWVYETASAKAGN